MRNVFHVLDSAHCENNDSSDSDTSLTVHLDITDFAQMNKRLQDLFFEEVELRKEAIKLELSTFKVRMETNGKNIEEENFNVYRFMLLGIVGHTIHELYSLVQDYKESVEDNSTDFIQKLQRHISALIAALEPIRVWNMLRSPAHNNNTFDPLCIICIANASTTSVGNVDQAEILYTDFHKMLCDLIVAVDLSLVE